MYSFLCHSLFNCTPILGSQHVDKNNIIEIRPKIVTSVVYSSIRKFTTITITMMTIHDYSTALVVVASFLLHLTKAGMH